MTHEEFVLEVGAMLMRDRSALLPNGIDIVTNTMNRGLSMAQRMIDFEKLRRTVTVEVDVTNGVNLNTAVLAGTSTTVEINRIKAGFLSFTNGGIVPLQFMSRDAYLERVGRRVHYDSRARSQPADDRYSARATYNPMLYKQANQLFLWMNNTTPSGASTVQVGLDVIIKDSPFSAVTDVKIAIATNELVGSQQGPFEWDTEEGSGYYSGTYRQIGTMNGQPLFAQQNLTSFLHYVPAQSGQSDYWLIVRAPYQDSYAWRSPDGVGGINSPSGWTATGFSIANGTVLGNMVSDSGGMTTTYNAAQNESFWLDECQEWLQLYVVQYLQSHYIKAQDKWPVTQKMIENAWHAVVAWNESCGDSEFPTDLD